MLLNGALLVPLANTLAFALSSCVLAVVIGGALAWIVERTNTPFRAPRLLAAFISFAIPYILYTIAWLLLLAKPARQRRADGAHRRQRAGAERLLAVGHGLVEGFLWSPLVFLMLAAVFRAMDPALEEAALMSGAGVWRTAVHDLLPPGAARASLAVVLLVFIRSVEPSTFRRWSACRTASTCSPRSVYLDTKRNPPDYGEASAFGVVLMLAMFGLPTTTATSRATPSASRP